MVFSFRAETENAEEAQETASSGCRRVNGGCRGFSEVQS